MGVRVCLSIAKHRPSTIEVSISPRATVDPRSELIPTFGQFPEF